MILHIFMNIGGRFFGTGGNRKGGPAWLDGDFRISRVYKRYHVVASALGSERSDGHSFTFQVGSYGGGSLTAELGQTVAVSYVELGSGALLAKTVGSAG